MGTEAITAALCWLTVSGALAVISLKDESASRLYHHLAGDGAGVYASGAPYGAYSFQVPVVSAQKPAASRVIPVKEHNYSFQNMNAYLKDSYGNRFLESKQLPQSVPFKPFPQQFIQLQELPAHFAQPLPAPSFTGFKQATPQIIVGSQYRLPLQPPQTASPVKHQYGFPQGIYAGNIKSLAPQSISQTQFHAGNIKSLAPQSISQTQFHAGNIKSLAPQSISQSQFHGSVVQVPVVTQQSYSVQGLPFHYGSKVTHNQPRPVSPSLTAQPQSTSNEATYANAQSEEQYHNDEPTFQRLQDAPRDESSEEEPSELPRHVIHHSDKTDQKVPVRETTITSFMNGMKTRVNLKTKQPVPLLDISLLEPLTFDNPLVPQVQHFLPKISEATYHKLPEFTQNGGKKHQKTTHKTKSYDSDSDKVKPKKYIPKKKQKYPLVEVQHSYFDEIPSASTVRPVITIKGTPNESPEFSYEINSPNYKETYKEQAINYNKETNSEPVHISYGSQKHEEPVHYTYVHSSKEPIHIKEVHYEGKGEGPKNLVHKFKPDDHKDGKQGEDSEESSEDDRSHHLHNENRDHQNEHRNHNKYHANHNHHPEHQKQYHENHNQPQENHNQHHENHNQHRENHNLPHENHNQHHENKNRENFNLHQENHNQHNENKKPEHREQEHHQKPNSRYHHSLEPIRYYKKTISGAFQPLSEYEEEIRIAAPIKVDPNQHVQPQPEPRQRNPSPAPQPHRSHSTPPHHDLHQNNHARTHEHENPKSIIMKDETPTHSDHEPPKGMFDREEDNEKDFEKAYKNAAFGFPAFRTSTDHDKDIYNPDNYGIPRDKSDYDFKNSPFQQYHDPSDSYPKSSRLMYKDAKDDTKENYFLDYSISKPESLTDYYKKKVDYYKLYKQQKPEKYVANDNENQKKQKMSEKYTAIPYNFYPTLDMKQFFAQYKAATPFMQEYDYSKGVPRDNSAHSTQPYHRYKSNTYFVEPQFQYGFEPISIPRLLDSELATMASNNSPESEKPGMRKKIYKENFYIKKTSMSDAGQNS